jgi:succinyl-CoA:acetate CoA-transferase
MSGPPTAEAPIPDARIADGLRPRDPAAAAALVPREATLLVSGFGGVGYPKAVPEAIAAGADRELTVISGGGVGGEIDDALVASGDLSRRYPFQTRQPVREAINDGRVAFHDRHISRLGDELRFRGLHAGIAGERVAVIEAVAVGDGWLVPSTSVGHTPAFVAAADRLIVEVNRTQPVELAAIHDVYRRQPPPDRDPIPLSGPADRIGGPAVSFDPDALAAVVATDRPDDPYEFRDPGDVEAAIADHLRGFLVREMAANPLLSDAVRLQFGVGSVGNALMGALADLDVGDRTLTYYGEVIQDGLLDLLADGDLAAASATSLALSRAGQERLFADPDAYAGDVVLRPADVSTAPELLDRLGVVGVNSALAVDLYGNANATHLRGTDVANGIGGGGDFARNCRLGVLALPSTAAGGDVSRIVPMARHVDHTEHDASVVVTEHGVADLRGKSPRERAAAVTRVADPAYRGALADYRDRAAAGGGNTPHAFASAFGWQDGAGEGDGDGD